MAEEKHTITIHTAQMRINDPDAIDITVKSANTPEGRVLAPTWKMVMKHKDGKLTDGEYTEQYLDLLRHRYRTDPQTFFDLLTRESVVLKCYCAAGTSCHRYLAVDVLVKIAEHKGIEVALGGEITQKDHSR
jgi:hypothetical protein